ncbi:hypothetical protein D3C77_462220 [compost metagenome]
MGGCGVLQACFYLLTRFLEGSVKHFRFDGKGIDHFIPDGLLRSGMGRIVGVQGIVSVEQYGVGEAIEPLGCKNLHYMNRFVSAWLIWERVISCINPMTPSCHSGLRSRNSNTRGLIIRAAISMSWAEVSPSMVSSTSVASLFVDMSTCRPHTPTSTRVSDSSLRPLRERATILKCRGLFLPAPSRMRGWIGCKDSTKSA